MNPKCPQCPEEINQDSIKFVFVEHQRNDGSIEKENPSDYHFLYICSMNHIFDNNGGIIENDLTMK